MPGKKGNIRFSFTTASYYVQKTRFLFRHFIILGPKKLSLHPSDNWQSSSEQQQDLVSEVEFTVVYNHAAHYCSDNAFWRPQSRQFLHCPISWQCYLKSFEDYCWSQETVFYSYF